MTRTEKANAWYAHVWAILTKYPGNGHWIYRGRKVPLKDALNPTAKERADG